MDTKELQAKLAEFAAEKERLDALAKAYEMVYNDLAGEDRRKLPPSEITTPSTSNDKEVPSVVDRDSQSPSKAQAVRDALENITGVFSIDEVLRHETTKTLGRADVSFVLSKMKKSKKIYVVTQGVGKIPSTYSKTPPKTGVYTTDNNLDISDML